MEKMGDKDIVKRAFKTFQNNFNQPKTSGENKSLVKEKVFGKAWITVFRELGHLILCNVLP